MEQQEFDAAGKTVSLGGPAQQQASWPARFGPFRVVRPLGQGGMGVVLEVVDDTGRRGALKTLPADSEPKLLARFAREAALQARLDHPNVAPVRVADMSHSPPYLVQAYFGGGTLAARLDQGPLPVAEVVTLARKLAAGLQHAHDRGVLHRDLKPENIIFDERGEPVIIDFGLARALDGGLQRLTATGEILGTPTFMAPEAVRGGPVDARTDVHGLAGVLYTALTGRAPHLGADLMRVLTAAIHQDPPRVSTLRAGVPAAIDEALARGLARDPAERPARAVDLAAALVRPVWGRRGLSSRRRTLAGALAGLAATFAGLLLCCPCVLADCDRRGEVASVATATRPVDASKAERRLEVERVLLGLTPLPADERAKRALAARLAASGVADLGTSAATLVLLLAGEPRTPDELAPAVSAVAAWGPSPLGRATAAALWSGARSARSPVVVDELARLALRAGPPDDVARCLALHFTGQAQEVLEAGQADAAALLIVAAEPGPARQDLVRAAAALERAWQATPDAAPFGGGVAVYERIAQTILDRYTPRESGRLARWQAWVAPVGELLHAAAPSDPVFAVLVGTEAPQGDPAAVARARGALARLHAARPVGLAPGDAARGTWELLHDALVAHLAWHLRGAGLRAELLADLRAATGAEPCGPSAFRELADLLAGIVRDPRGAPIGAYQAREELSLLVAAAPDGVVDAVRARLREAEGR